MTVITMSRTDMSVVQYNNVVEIAFNPDTNIYTISYNNGNTTMSFPKSGRSIHIMES